MSTGSLPQSVSEVEVRLLDGGSFMAELDKLHAGAGKDRFRMYNWAFHIYHAKANRHVLWDLGMTGVLPLAPIRKAFPNATGFFGPGTKAFCAPGHLQDVSMQWDGSFFDPDNATENWAELEGPWVPFGPFEKAMDFFGDGSLFIIQAPGHMPGNLCAAAHVSGGAWVLLGSDCCHSRKILDGECEIAMFSLPNGQKTSLQADIPAAKDTIERIKKLEKLGAHVALAHDAQWIKEGSDQILMGLLVLSDSPVPPQTPAMAKSLRVGVIGPAGFTGSYLCVELIKRGHHVIGMSRSPEKIGAHEKYTPRKVDVDAQSIDELAAAFKDVDVLVNAYGPHTAGAGALKYMPFLEVTRKMVLATRLAKVPYFVQVGGTGSLYVPGRQSFQCAAETTDFWLAFRRAIADSEAHTVYMEERLGPIGARLRGYRNARLAARAGKETEETKAVIKQVEDHIRSGDQSKEFVTGARTSFMFFDGNIAFRWTYVSPSAMYRSGKRTGKYETGTDYLPLKGDPMDGRELDGRLHGISAGDLAIAIADEAEAQQRVGKHWTAWADMSNDEPTPSYITLADV
ncbi:hypothetical protein SLS56_009479 [Neofusicoccum ribis]|uniref:NAD(P)-binding domain-containing protein n=1 Tax=Neofusicoccum ribis TaxID=45134 RepID=A0ABR3SH86_9PEZI